MRALVDMAIPLFVFAAAVCRYIGDKGDNPKKRSDTILTQSITRHPRSQSLIGRYLPILDQLFDTEDDVEKKQQTSEFRKIVGSIVVLTFETSSLDCVACTAPWHH